MARGGNVRETLLAIRESGEGMTQRDLAAVLEISPAFLNDIEHGRRNLSNEKILACKVTGIRASLIGARCGEYRAMIAYLESEGRHD